MENRRFGIYLRTVREDRKLSLDAVEEMSVGFPERITKSHLSRIETGQAVPTFPRMFALSQIYGVPIASLAERFETDLRTEMAPPERTEWTAADLQAEYEHLRQTGDYGRALSLIATLRDRARADAVAVPVPRQRLTRWAIACLLHLERYESAKIECELLLGDAELDPAERLPILLYFVSCCYRLKRYTIAKMGLALAEDFARSSPPAPKLVADIEDVRAAVHYALGALDEAAQSFESASTLFAAIPAPFDACRCQINLSQILIDRQDFDGAATKLRAALTLTEESGYDRLRALVYSHLAVIALHKRDLETAESYAIRSNSIARPREYLSLIFRNCYQLREVARQRGDVAAARANERSLKAYLGRVDTDLPEAVAFRKELEEGRR